MPATVVQAGTYTLELDTGWDSNSFRLNNATKGKLNGTYGLGPQTQYADITQYVTNISYTRGRRKIDYQFGAGTMSFTMNDQTGILGPYDSTSPYYDPANNQPGLAPMRRIRLSRGSQRLFTGYVTSYSYDFQLAGFNIVNVQCADDFYRLAQTNLDAWNVTAQKSGARLTSLLALPEVNFTGTTNIATGTVDLGHDASYDVPAGTNTLAYINQINAAEQGRVFCSNNGTITFQKRIAGSLSPAVISFRDDGTGAKYDSVEIEFDADGVVNRSYVKGLNGTSATNSNPASIAKYFTQNWSITDSLLHEAGQIGTLATYLLQPEPDPRYTSVTTWFGLLTDAQKATVAAIEIGDTISVFKAIPGLGSTVSENSSVEGIQATIDVARGHRITFFTAPTLVYYSLRLNDAVYGKLNFNVLG